MSFMLSDNDEPDLFGSEGSRSGSLTRRRWLVSSMASALGLAGAGYYYWSAHAQPHLVFDGQYAHAGPDLPPVIHDIVRYANELQSAPYERGGGHRMLFDNGFDCSGALSHILYRAGLLSGPLTSEGFARYGQEGPGRFVNLFVKPKVHVFMAVCGLRFDTSGGSAGEGPRWSPMPRNPDGFIIRHPFHL